MATSESEDFESADEELGHNTSGSRRNVRKQQWSSPTTIGSDSDDDADYIPQTINKSPIYSERPEKPRRSRLGAKTNDGLPVTGKRIDEAVVDAEQVTCPDESRDRNEPGLRDKERKRSTNNKANEKSLSVKPQTTDIVRPTGQVVTDTAKSSVVDQSSDLQADHAISSSVSKPTERVRQQRKPQQQRSLGARKLGTKLTNDDETALESKLDDLKVTEVGERVDEILAQADSQKLDAKTFEKAQKDSALTSDSTGWEDMEIPEELKSNKKFKEIFEPEGWEGIGDDIELPDDLTEEKLQPVLDRLSAVGRDFENSSGGWGGWGNWGVSSLINTATAGVSTLTSHVSHGLTLLEETIGVPDPSELDKPEQQEEEPVVNEQTPEDSQISPSQSSFGFSNFISGVSTITKLVESTSSKVVSGGLDTLEAIGKKTMEVLQEGDPGLKKKRAFLKIDSDKPTLSKVLREAKEKADAEEKTLEEKQMARKVHFESIFDDYQGLVHLEALEMLSKQSNLKIQQYLINLNTNELTSAQETLDEVKELCDLGEGNEEEDETDKHFKDRLQEASTDLRVEINYVKLYELWEDMERYLSSSAVGEHREVFCRAISTLAQFTALSVERFHKTAELLLIKERRSTVNEADALVQIARILSGHIGLIANNFCDWLNKASESVEHREEINKNITTVFMEAASASSYIQEAFRLLIPILQVGAI